MEDTVEPVVVVLDDGNEGGRIGSAFVLLLTSVARREGSVNARQELLRECFRCNARIT